VDDLPAPNGWSEKNSKDFVDHGRSVVPERERQIQAIVSLVPCPRTGCSILDLCCGEGLLAESLLERYPTAIVHALDGSPTMLARSRERLARFGNRVSGSLFDLADRSWREPAYPVDAVVSSLGIHHLSDSQKLELFSDMYALLTEGGVFIIADVVQAAGESGKRLAADTWDAEVRKRALELGDQQAFDWFERERFNMYRYFDPDDIDKPSRLYDQLTWLQQAGFDEVDAYWMLAGHAIFGGVKRGAKDP
jgi:cyclopropane fatty-acyl-phospholipid synthase-like methyltransferase